MDEGAPEIWTSVAKSAFPEDAYDCLSEEDRLTVSKWNEKRRILLQKRVEEEVQAEMEADLSLVRESIPFVRLKVCSVEPCSSTKCEEAMLTIWNPTEDQLGTVLEGQSVEAQNLSVRQTMFDGFLQLTGNSRTVFEEFRPAKPSVPQPLAFRKRRFLTLFDVHLLSHKLLEDDASLRDVDTAAAQLRIIQTGKNGQEVCMYVSDESSLLLRIECDRNILKALTQEEDSSTKSAPVFAFCDLRLLPFDLDKNCAVAKFCENSSICKTTPRLEELRQWATYSNPNNSFCLSQLYFDANLPIWHSNDRSFSAVGYVVGLKCVSSKNLHIEVDCGASQVEEWELPVPLLEEVLPVLSRNQKTVSLLPIEEERLGVFGILGEFFRAKGTLWHFQLQPNSASNSTPSQCQFLVTNINVADPCQMGKLFSNAALSS